MGSFSDSVTVFAKPRWAGFLRHGKELTFLLELERLSEFVQVKHSILILRKLRPPRLKTFLTYLYREWYPELFSIFVVLLLDYAYMCLNNNSVI